ncbi:MAG: hypothetical protein MZV64_11910 [Ignavibacteriales bacterium]|nr:hypothetical protein [Ignavibacteriales bacterium]
MALRAQGPGGLHPPVATTAMAAHVEAMLELQKQGARAFDYGNNLRGQAQKAGVAEGLRHPRLRAGVHPAARSASARARSAGRRSPGEPQDIYATDEAVLKEFPEDEALARWIRKAREPGPVPGAAVAHLLAGLRRAGPLRARSSTTWCKKGKITAPVVIGRDHLDTGSVASPNRETEGMRDGSDAIADWPILNALLNAVSGASWVSVHHGGGVGIGLLDPRRDGRRRRRDAADGGARLERVLTADPGTGRRAPRRRRLPRCDRLREKEPHQDPDDEVKRSANPGVPLSGWLGYRLWLRPREPVRAVPPLRGPPPPRGSSRRHPSPPREESRENGRRTNRRGRDCLLWGTGPSASSSHL